MAPAERRLSRWVIVGVNVGWAAWAIISSFYFLMGRETLGRETSLRVFHQVVYGYGVVGWSLLACGVISLIAVACRKLDRLAAIVCAIWCAVTGVWLILATAGVGQADVDGWILMLVAYTSVMRWALLVLAPHVTR